MTNDLIICDEKENEGNEEKVRNFRRKIHSPQTTTGRISLARSFFLVVVIHQAHPLVFLAII